MEGATFVEATFDVTTVGRFIVVGVVVAAFGAAGTPLFTFGAIEVVLAAGLLFTDDAPKLFTVEGVLVGVDGFVGEATAVEVFSFVTGAPEKLFASLMLLDVVTLATADDGLADVEGEDRKLKNPGDFD